MERFPKASQNDETELAKNDTERQPQKEGVDLVFEQHPELASIGTREQYLEYLQTVFRDSKIRSIAYHGGDGKVTDFERREGGIFFTRDIGYALRYADGKPENLTSVVLNSTEPRSVPQISRTLVAVDYRPAIERDGADALIGEESMGIVTRAGQNFLAKGQSIAVMDPGQVHVLGSPGDVERFTNYLKDIPTHD